MSKTKLRKAAATGALGFLSVVFALALMAGAAFAQSATGQIIGKVTDPNGAVVAAANITVKSVDTDAKPPRFRTMTGAIPSPPCNRGSTTSPFKAATSKRATSECR